MKSTKTYNFEFSDLLFHFLEHMANMYCTDTNLNDHNGNVLCTSRTYWIHCMIIISKVPGDFTVPYNLNLQVYMYSSCQVNG